MLNNKKFQIRLPEELLAFCEKHTDNTSLFIRNLIREKMNTGIDDDDTSKAFELIFRTPYVYYATLHRIVDGDTLFVKIDIGFFTVHTEKIRLAGVDTPPLKTEKGKPARDFLNKELTGANMVLITRKKEKYGRYLAYIYYHQEYKDFEDIVRYGKSIKDELLNAKLGVVYG